jgi:hypothetical protein
MVTATAIAIFIIPLLFVLVERVSGAGKRQGEGVAAPVAQSGQ